MELNCVKRYIAIWDGKRNFIWSAEKKQSKITHDFQRKNVFAVEIIKERFDQVNITYDYNKFNDFVVYVDKTIVSNNIGLFIDIMKTRRGMT